jgi:hypothetical protein
MKRYNEGETITAEIMVRIPAEATDEEVRAWLDFNLGCRGALNTDNPLSDYDVEASDVLMR